jgi:hypothetical protein
MSQAALPVFEIGLNALIAVLDKAAPMRRRRKSIRRLCSVGA